MEAVKKLQWINDDSWGATLASLLPLWLLAFTFASGGFSRPFLPPWLELAPFILSIAAGIALLWKGWLSFDILFVTFFPFLFVLPPLFDEMSPRYETPFILACALILSVGIVVAQRSGSVTVRWLVLLFVFIAVLALASNGVQNYWQMASDLGYVNCSPGAQGCAPLTGSETPWWILFFRL